MKVYLFTKTLSPGVWEHVEINNRFHADDPRVAPAHHVIRKAERIALALKKGGTNAEIAICPESAAEFNRLLDEGLARCNQIWHTRLIKPSRARGKAHARLVKMKRRALNPNAR